MNVEICVDSVESAVAAARGGAKRIELCSALSEGGITPSAGLISSVRSSVDIDLFVIIRPRGGNFVYTETEFEVMRQDILEAKTRKADGIVLGILTEADDVDLARMRALIDIARPLGVTFHRAFDVCRDLDRALEDVIACGADRILTSGGQTDAMRGVARIARLEKRSGGRIAIMAGGGIRSSNVLAIAKKTGVREIHTSLSKNIEESAELGSSPNGRMSYRVLEHDVRAFKAAIDSLSVDWQPGAPVQ